MTHSKSDPSIVALTGRRYVDAERGRAGGARPGCRRALRSVGRPASAVALVFFFPAGFDISIKISHAGGGGGLGRGVASAAPPRARQKKDRTRRTGPSAVVGLGVGSLRARGPRRVGGRAGGVILAAPRARAAPRGRDAHSAAARLRSLGQERNSGVCSESWCFGRGVARERVQLYGPVRAPFWRWCWPCWPGRVRRRGEVPSRCAGRRGTVGCCRGVLRPPRRGGCDHAVMRRLDGISQSSKDQTCLTEKFSRRG